MGITMKKNLRLVPKCTGNMVVIILCMPDGRRIQVARLLMPDDGQLCDTVDCVKEIIKILEKRISSSM